ncbi:cellulose biosynthesis cyclic di-GMP-binding regulatory protein BcsB [Robbsia sp. Bb-Pol-6]|uniref:Cyclic di-GMP-binding protein n=1 Tax=Robbsia betulipollinis TaxID=2981849 RepID=A0ABT3ZLW2_9BURK|nr:cellulose biosynthesis cyclic di-GMP-binding regulatory protein BcsB [Robbsia betulipollinis]MCY0387546.1 cellulose biosynthesis cyclic di-GMP-binding regulatory protein BcsB [Robbsia betulipollinis]
MGSADHHVPSSSHRGRGRAFVKACVLAMTMPGLLLAPLGSRAAPPAAAGTAVTLASPAAIPGATPGALAAAGTTADGTAPALTTLATPVAATAPAPAADPNRTLTTADAGEVLPNGGRRYVLSFRQLGILYPPELRGTDGTVGVPFAVRSDEIVTGARLHLVYSYSPALITNLSHLKVMVNGVVAATVPLPKEQAGMPVTRDIPIEPRMVTDFNQLSIQLIGHYTMQCEDPAHSSLWANLSNASSLELTVASLPQANDLSALPLPFFDRRDIRRLQLPFVFGATPGNATLEAAGIVSSWFGSLAGYRGAVFPAQLNALPATGNAVVFATSDERPAGLTLPVIQGPTIAIATQPNDPKARLLLVLGRDANELKTAATALALGRISLNGQSVTVTALKGVEPRKPYDAPNWVPSDRAVRFGELNALSGLGVSGYNPDLIRLNLRLPPDLFAWRTNGVPLHLIYRFTPRPSADKSTLNISVNDNFVASLRIPTYAAGGVSLDALTGSVAADGTVSRAVDLAIPSYLLPSQSQMQFHYYYDYVKNGACKDVPLDNVRGAIDPNSTLDLSSFPHYIAMPDLAAFGNGGFPFTRMADLSETAVVLPDSPSASDYGTYLAALGMMGASTGYPALGVTLARAADVKTVADKDLLLIGAPSNLSLLQGWADSMPFSASASTDTFNVSDFAFGLLDWWHGTDRTVLGPRHAHLSLSGGGMGDAVVMGFESPLKNGRSVVALIGSTPQNHAELLDVLMDADLVKQLQGGLAIVHARTVSSIASGDVYYVGALPPLEYLHWVLSAHPLLLALAALVLAVVIAALLYRMLRRIAARRLKK